MAVMVLHFLSNIMGSFTYPVFANMAHTSYTALFMAAACLVALVLIYTSQFKLEKKADNSQFTF